MDLVILSHRMIVSNRFRASIQPRNQDTHNPKVTKTDSKCYKKTKNVKNLETFNNPKKPDKTFF